VVLCKKKKKMLKFTVNFYFVSADLPLTHHNPPFRLNFAATPHLPQTQPACLTVSFALPIEQKKPPVKGEPLNVGQVPQIHSFMFSGVFGTVIPMFNSPSHKLCL
jgi:hypothetical protein